MNINIKKQYIFFLLIILVNIYPVAWASIHVVAAENVYGNITKELGGSFVTVTSILNNPAQDPHLFSINASIAKAIKEADIIIINGANYDPWMYPILRSSNEKQIDLIIVSNLINLPDQQNPHLWYLPTIIPVFAKEVVSKLCIHDSKNCSYFVKRLNNFMISFGEVQRKIKNLKNHYQDIAVIATEPLFNYMALSLGLKMYGEKFQLSMMNDLPPSISDIKEFEDNLRSHKVSLLFYNKQVLNPLTNRMLRIAKEEKIPIIGLSEMMPTHLSYTEWLMTQLQMVDSALKHK